MVYIINLFIFASRKEPEQRRRAHKNLKNMEVINVKDPKRAKKKRLLVREVLEFVVICTFLALLNWWYTPQTWWSAWAAGGWALAIVLKVIRAATDSEE